MSTERRPQDTSPRIDGTPAGPARATRNPTTTLEIAVQDAAGARVALENGADRIELCSALGLGGLTPSLATTEQAVGVGIGVHVLIRPRGGGYVYTAEEVDLMAADIAHAARAGVAGIVIGALTEDDGGLDIPVLSGLVAAAHAINPALEVTVHRCVDVLLEKGMSITKLVAQLRVLGVHRILTSGGAPASGDGAEVLHRLRTEAQGNPQVQAGGGVKLEDIPALAGLDGIHLSARSHATRGASGPGGGDSAFDVTSAELVAAAAAALAACR